MRKKKKANVIRKDTSAKARKKIAKKRIAAPKTRNSGTMTENQFWSMIRSALRQRSIYWKPILKVKNDTRIPYVGPNKRRKFSYICSECKKEFDSKMVNVHHLTPAGTLTCGADLPKFVENLFCEEGLILLCKHCHDAKHPKKEKQIKNKI